MIKVQNIKKEYKKIKKKGFFNDLFRPEKEVFSAVNDITFEIKEGESVAFLGKNGAGKTTTIKMLSGILYPTSGSIDIMGFKPTDRKEDFLKNIGVVLGSKNILNEHLTPNQNFQIVKEIYKIDKVTFTQGLEMMTGMLEMERNLDVQLKRLSLGEKMKSELIASILHMPKILFLDEPTVGLDVVAKDKVREFLKEIQTKNKITLLLTSHDMDDIEAVCDRVIIIDKGKLIHDGDLKKLYESYNQTKFITVYFKSDIQKIEFDTKFEIAERDKQQSIFKVTTKNMGEFLSYISTFPTLKDIDIKTMPLDNILKDIFEKNAKNLVVSNES